MATFYYDRFSNESIYSQWTKHLQSEVYIKDISDIISKNKKELQATISNASSEQQQAILQVCGHLDDGFGLISSHLSDIKYELGEIRGEINAMASMLDWKLSCLIEQQRITNQLLRNIIQILRIPESQKQRAYYIEQGLKYLKNAFIEGTYSSFFNDAMESFKESEKIERKDYFTLNRIGQIFLYSINHLNIPLAEEYFLKSAREALAEVNAGLSISKNYLSPEILEGNYTIILQSSGERKINVIKVVRVYTDLELKEAKDLVDSPPKLIKENISKEEAEKIKREFEEAGATVAIKNTQSEVMKLQTAEAYLYASRTCYLQQKVSEAINYATKAYNLVPEFVEAGFEKAKYLAANNQIEESVKVLETVIKKDRYFSAKTLLDQDLSSKSLVLKLLETFQIEAISRAKNGVKECVSIITSRSKAKEIIEKIENQISKNSFLSCMDAIDLLNTDYQIPYYNYSVGSYNKETIHKQIINQPLKIIDFIKKENHSASELEDLKEEIKKRITKDRALIGSLNGAGIGFMIGFFRGCTLSPLSMDVGTWFSTIIICLVIGAIIGAVIGNAKEIVIEEH